MLSRSKLAILVLGTILLVGTLALVGCGAGAKACAAIDIAKNACDVLPIRYMDSAGQERTQDVPKSELAALAHAVSMRAPTVPSCDGGCPDAR
jgi:hypothetical protein